MFTIGFARRAAAYKRTNLVFSDLDRLRAIAEGYDIAVEPRDATGHTDTEIARAVRNALAWNGLVPEARLRSTVSGGVVTLEGEVDSWTQQADAERSVRLLDGVCAVVNLIGVEAHPVEGRRRKAIGEPARPEAEREGAFACLACEDDDL